MKEQFLQTLRQIEKIGGHTRQLVFEPPAGYDDLYEIEQKLKYPIPTDFKNVLLTVSSHCEFRWFLPENLKLPQELRGIFSGDVHWGLDFILDFNENKDDWIRQVFSDAENEYNKVWYNKFVFQEVGNGDYLSIDLAPTSYGKIIYLSHDDGEGHGYVMANSFPELLHSWTLVACTGGEDWQWLPFCQNKTSGIDAGCPNALLWRETIGLI